MEINPFPFTVRVRVTVANRFMLFAVGKDDDDVETQIVEGDPVRVGFGFVEHADDEDDGLGWYEDDEE